MKINDFSENKISGEITLDKISVLFFSIPFDDGWQAFDNGKPAPTVKANIGFTGLILDKGRHDIELKYTPKYMVPGLAVSFIALVGYMMMVFLWGQVRSAKKNIQSSNL